MKKTSVIIDLSEENYIKSYIEKIDNNKTKIYNKNKVKKIGLDECNSIDNSKAIESISKAYLKAVKNINEKIDETVIILGLDFVKMPSSRLELNMENKRITKYDIKRILHYMVKYHEYYDDHVAIQVKSEGFILDSGERIVDPLFYKTSKLTCNVRTYFVDKNVFLNFQEIFRKCGIINPTFKAFFSYQEYKYELDIDGNLIELEILSDFEKKSAFGKWLHERRFLLREFFKFFCKKLNS